MSGSSYWQGLAAHTHGLPRIACPFVARDEQRAEWLLGWDTSADLVAPLPFPMGLSDPPERLARTG